MKKKIIQQVVNVEVTELKILSAIVKKHCKVWLLIRAKKGV